MPMATSKLTSSNSAEGVKQETTNNSNAASPSHSNTSTPLASLSPSSMKRFRSGVQAAAAAPESLKPPMMFHQYSGDGLAFIPGIAPTSIHRQHSSGTAYALESSLFDQPSASMLQPIMAYSTAMPDAFNFNQQQQQQQQQHQIQQHQLQQHIYHQQQQQATASNPTTAPSTTSASSTADATTDDSHRQRKPQSVNPSLPGFDSLNPSMSPPAAYFNNQLFTPQQPYDRFNYQPAQQNTEAAQNPQHHPQVPQQAAPQQFQHLPQPPLQQQPYMPMLYHPYNLRNVSVDLFHPNQVGPRQDSLLLGINREQSMDPNNQDKLPQGSLSRFLSNGTQQLMEGPNAPRLATGTVRPTITPAPHYMQQFHQQRMMGNEQGEYRGWAPAVMPSMPVYPQLITPAGVVHPSPNSVISPISPDSDPSSPSTAADRKHHRDYDGDARKKKQRKLAVPTNDTSEDDDKVSIGSTHSSKDRHVNTAVKLNTSNDDSGEPLVDTKVKQIFYPRPDFAKPHRIRLIEVTNLQTHEKSVYAHGADVGSVVERKSNISRLFGKFTSPDEKLLMNVPGAHNHTVGQESNILTELGIRRFLQTNKMKGQEHYKNWITSQLLPCLHIGNQGGDYEQQAGDEKEGTPIISIVTPLNAAATPASLSAVASPAGAGHHHGSSHRRHSAAGSAGASGHLLSVRPASVEDSPSSIPSSPASNYSSSYASSEYNR